MWPDSPFARGRGSFLRPVPTPVHGVDVAPFLSVSVPCEWLPYIRGALQQLLLQATWDTSDPDVLRFLQGNAFNLIDLFQECGSPPPFSCPYDAQALGGDDGGYVQVVEGSPPWSGNVGSWEPLGGWVGTCADRSTDGAHMCGVDIHKVFGAPVSIDQIEMVYNLRKGTWNVDAGDVNGILLYLGGVLVAHNYVEADTDPDGSFKTIGLAGGPFSVDEIRVLVRANTYTGGGVEGDSSIAQVNYNVPGGGCG